MTRENPQTTAPYEIGGDAGLFCGHKEGEKMNAIITHAPTYRAYREAQRTREHENATRGYTPAYTRVRTLTDALGTIGYKLIRAEYIGLDWAEGDGFRYYAILAESEHNVTAWTGIDRHENGEARFILDGGKYCLKGMSHTDAEVRKDAHECFLDKIERFAPTTEKRHTRGGVA